MNEYFINEVRIILKRIILNESNEMNHFENPLTTAVYRNCCPAGNMYHKPYGPARTTPRQQQQAIQKSLTGMTSLNVKYENDHSKSADITMLL